MRTRAMGVGISRVTMLFTAVLLVACPGCGDKGPPTGEVSGTVTFKGSPLPEGMITFINTDDARAASTAILDGSYRCGNAPVGNCGIEVVVNTTRAAPGHAINPEKVGKMMRERSARHGEQVITSNDDVSFEIPKPVKSNAIPIPRKFANLKTSKLTFTVVEGKQTYDITLQP